MAKLEQEIIDGVTVLRLSGSLTQEGLSEVEEPFMSATRGRKGMRVVLDVAKVDALTTPAITMFLATVRSVESSGGRVVFAGTRGITADIFARCRLNLIFTITPTVTDAIRIVNET
jgi:anti-anti-sigma factor